VGDLDIAKHRRNLGISRSTLNPENELLYVCACRSDGIENEDQLAGSIIFKLDARIHLRMRNDSNTFCEVEAVPLASR